MYFLTNYTQSLSQGQGYGDIQSNFEGEHVGKFSLHSNVARIFLSLGCWIQDVASKTPIIKLTVSGIDLSRDEDPWLREHQRMARHES